MTDYQRILYALETVGHPIRLKILKATFEAETTPNDFSVQEKIPLGTTAYHFRELHMQGILREHKVTRVRGALQHHYRITRRGKLIWGKIFPEGDDG